ncbi:hypothetical protein TNCV_3745221 [Trichonephila clavipes]|nr:hypothetical protein TNCV_3745221 [Trichonephila clavipes]
MDPKRSNMTTLLGRACELLLLISGFASSDDFGFCVKWVISANLNNSTGLRRQSSGVSLCGGNWATKLPAVIGIRLKVAALKIYQFPGFD